MRFPPFYACELGAADGVFGTRSKALEDQGWIVLLIEGNPLYWPALTANRTRVLPVAVAETAGLADFHVYGRDDGYYASKSALVPAGHLPQEGQYVGAFRVPTLPLYRCLQVAGFPRLDMLWVDVEGGELEVLKGLGDYRPHTIIAENFVPENPHVREYLATLGYRFTQHEGFDDHYELTK